MADQPSLVAIDDASAASASDASRSAGETQRLCAWCEGPIPERARSDSIYCGTPHRQAAHRFTRQRVARVANGRPLRLAYADPPYPGNAARYYADHPDFAGEVDHEQLVERLVAEFPDGWALSTSAAAVHDVLPSCPPGVRVAAWVRGDRGGASYRPLSAWEPVIYFGGRAYLSSGSARRIDALVIRPHARGTDPNHVVGAKPAAFCWWLFDLLGALPGDEMVDLFPGSGGVARAWRYASSPTSGATPDPSRSPAATTDAFLADRADASSRSSTTDASRQARADGSLADEHDASFVDEADASLDTAVNG